MLKPNKKLFIQLKKIVAIVLKEQKMSISQRILDYVFDNLLSVTYAIGICLSILIIFFYCNSLLVHPNPQFNIESSIYLFVILPFVVGILFIGFTLLCFYPGYLGYEIYKDFENPLVPKTNSNKAGMKILFYYYIPLILLLTLFTVLPALFKHSNILLFCSTIVFPTSILAIEYFLFRWIDGIENSKFIGFCICFYIAWFIYIMILMMMSSFLSMASLHLSNLDKYLYIAFTLAIISLFNLIISCKFHQIPILNRYILVAFFGIMILMISDSFFGYHSKILQGIIHLSGIRKDNVTILINSEGCDIIKMRTFGVIIAVYKYTDGMLYSIPF